MAERIARHELAVLGEFDGEAVVGTPVEPGQKAFDHEARPQIEAGELRDEVRIEKPRAVVAHGEWSVARSMGGRGS
jgi:hypothetical protein